MMYTNSEARCRTARQPRSGRTPPSPASKQFWRDLKTAGLNVSMQAASLHWAKALLAG